MDQFVNKIHKNDDIENKDKTRDHTNSSKDQFDLY